MSGPTRDELKQRSAEAAPAALDLLAEATDLLFDLYAMSARAFMQGATMAANFAAIIVSRSDRSRLEPAPRGTADIKAPRASRNLSDVSVARLREMQKMYTLQKAKEEIDAVAKHATDIVAYTLAIPEVFDSKLDAFKKEIASLIESKFAELEKTIVGERQEVQTTAVQDLGAKVAQLMHATQTHPPHHEGGAEQHGHPEGEAPHGSEGHPHE